MILELTLLVAVFVLYWIFSGRIGGVREQALERLMALLWSQTGAYLIAAVFALIGFLWFVIGGFWALVFNSTRFNPGQAWSNRIKTALMFPVTLASFAFTGDGRLRWWPNF